MDGLVDIEHYSYQAFNESVDLRAIFDYCKMFTGKYSDIASAAKFLRKKGNISWSQKHQIALKDPWLDRKPQRINLKNVTMNQKAKNRRDAFERKFDCITSKDGI